MDRRGYFVTCLVVLGIAAVYFDLSGNLRSSSKFPRNISRDRWQAPGETVKRRVARHSPDSDKHIPEPSTNDVANASRMQDAPTRLITTPRTEPETSPKSQEREESFNLAYYGLPEEPMREDTMRGSERSKEATVDDTKVARKSEIKSAKGKDKMVYLQRQGPSKLDNQGSPKKLRNTDRENQKLRRQRLKLARLDNMELAEMYRSNARERKQRYNQRLKLTLLSNSTLTEEYRKKCREKERRRIQRIMADPKAAEVHRRLTKEYMRNYYRKRKAEKLAVLELAKTPSPKES